MVVAEIPLWAVHSNSSSSGGNILNDNKSNNTGASNDLKGHASRANDSLSLLESLAGGGGSTKKCAIYSVDLHPSGSKFVSGGGDGTVRIWSTDALFAKHRAAFVSNGIYESSESSDGADDGGATDQQQEDNDDDNAAKQQLQQENGVANQNDSTDVVGGMEPEVNDLSLLVRRKKDGSTPSKPPPVPASDTPSMPQRAQQLKSKQDSTATAHRLLCTLSAHTGSSVLAVRFSTTGTYLASAGDDAVVCVYAQSSSAAAVGNLNDSVEHWSRIKLCRGHTLDVVGIAWAPDDSHLVSCSLDSDAPVIVWKLTDLESQQRRTQSNVLCNPYKILGKDDHTSTVKGVTFDPAGSYLASSGDDPAVCVWRAHDDWGLEKRIDASSGIFRRWKEDDTRELSSQTLFRRLSWSTDGTYICSTNSSIKNRHVASTISREGWSVSSNKSAASGAANLVGHKQPIVVARHCPFLVDARKKKEEEENDDEPDYGTLIALGDKGGLVTVWSTRKSRPIFKLQCSESRCTVTDLTWGRVRGDVLLLVSLLDGQIVALRFSVPRELGALLSEQDQKRVFQLRYGIDFDDDNGFGGRRIFVGDNSAPKLIENALQFALEDQDDDDSDEGANTSEDDFPLSSLVNPSKVKASQQESRSNGKKRIRPVLLSVEDDGKKGKRSVGDGKPEKKKRTDPIKDALDSAARAASAADDVAASSARSTSRMEIMGNSSQAAHEVLTVPQHHGQATSSTVGVRVPQIPYETVRTLSRDLPQQASETESGKLVADCTNSNRAPSGSSGQSMTYVSVTISRDGKVQWRDELVGTSCTALAVSQPLMAVGTSDGCLYLYGAPPSQGWVGGAAFRSHPPLVLGSSVVSLQFTEGEGKLEIVVVTSDGSFGVYNLIPETRLLYKGSVLPPMSHMVLASSREIPLPKLARIQTTESGRLLMILSLESTATPRDSRTNMSRSTNPAASVGPGGSLQAFVYDTPLETWLRVSDSRFVLSDFYSTLPKSKGGSSARHVLAKLDDAVRSGCGASSVKPSRRNRASSDAASAMYNQAELGSILVSRAHCEDRLACALALGSSAEFKFWLTCYVRTLARVSNEAQLRLLFDMLLGGKGDSASSSCWWLSSAATILNHDRRGLLKNVVIPEMSKNRALQRLTNELSMEINQVMET